MAESEGPGAISEVERVAEAFYEALPGKGWTNGRTGAHVVWANLRDEHKVEWLQAAGTAIAALRPDREQVSGEAEGCVCDHPGSPPIAPDCPEHGWMLRPGALGPSRDPLPADREQPGGDTDAGGGGRCICGAAGLPKHHAYDCPVRLPEMDAREQPAGLREALERIKTGDVPKLHGSHVADIRAFATEALAAALPEGRP